MVWMVIPLLFQFLNKIAMRLLWRGCHDLVLEHVMRRALVSDPVRVTVTYRGTSCLVARTIQVSCRRSLIYSRVTLGGKLA